MVSVVLEQLSPGKCLSMASLGGSQAGWCSRGSCCWVPSIPWWISGIWSVRHPRVSGLRGSSPNSVLGRQCNVCSTRLGRFQEYSKVIQLLPESLGRPRWGERCSRVLYLFHLFIYLWSCSLRYGVWCHQVGCAQPSEYQQQPAGGQI